MVRASLVLGVLLATSLAGAAPKGYKLALGSEWQDVTAEALKDPAIANMQKQLQDMGGTFEAAAYALPDGSASLFIAAVEMPDIPQTRDQIEAFERGAAARAGQAGTTEGYREDRTPLTFDATEHIRKPTMLINTRRVTGFLQGGGLRSISINCYGEAPACNPLLEAVAVDTTSFVKLDSLDATGKESKLRLVFLIGCGVMALLVVAAAGMMKRRSSRALR